MISADESLNITVGAITDRESVQSENSFAISDRSHVSGKFGDCF